MKSTLFPILFFLLCSIFGYGQVVLSSDTDTKEYSLRNTFTLNIGLEIAGNNFEQHSPLKLPDLSKFEILGNASEVVSFIDPNTGNIIRQTVYQLILEPKYTGKIKIGSALVKINGKIYKSEPFDIFVKDNPKKALENNFAKNIQLLMEVQDDAVHYQYEPIKVTLKAYSRNLNQLRKLHKIEYPKKSKIHFINSEKQDIEVHDFTEDIVYQVISSFIIFPENTGIITIPSIYAKVDKERITSNPIKLNIKPLPSDAPKNFVNAVGDFKLKISSNKKNIEIDKPFDVFIKLSGEGNLEHINLPKILKSTDYQIFTPKKSIKMKPTEVGLKGEVIEHYIIIPKKEGNINILTEEFSFFNPKISQYQNIKESYSIIAKKKNDSINKTSSIEKIIGDTGHILKKTDLLPVPSNNEEIKTPWNALFIGVFIIICLICLFVFVFKKKKKKTTHKRKTITTISEEEETLKNTLFIEKDYYFKAMERAIMQKNNKLFFEYYEELHQDAEKQIEFYQNKNIYQFLETEFGIEYLEKFKLLREKIQIEKYSPLSQDLYEIHNLVVNFYSKIMK